MITINKFLLFFKRLNNKEREELLSLINTTKDGEFKYHETGKPIADILKTFMKKNSLRSIMDLGCGYGQFLSYFDEYITFGIEKEQKLIDLALFCRIKKIFKGDILEPLKYKADLIYFYEPFSDRNKHIEFIKNILESTPKQQYIAYLSANKHPIEYEGLEIIEKHNHLIIYKKI